MIMDYLNAYFYQKDYNTSDNFSNIRSDLYNIIYYIITHRGITGIQCDNIDTDLLCYTAFHHTREKIGRLFEVIEKHFLEEPIISLENFDKVWNNYRISTKSNKTVFSWSTNKFNHDSRVILKTNNYRENLVLYHEDSLDLVDIENDFLGKHITKIN
jgi:hypothetical protein